MKSYNTSLDYIRFLSVFLVTYGHVLTYGADSSVYFGKASSYLSPLSSEIVYKLVAIKYVNLGEIGVSLFFLISGYLLYLSFSEQDFNFIKFARKKIIRIMPTAFFSVLLCYFIAIYLTGNMKLEISFYNLMTILVNGLLIQEFFSFPIIIPVYWFLFVIIKLYFLIAIIKILGISNLWIILLFMFSFVTFNSLFNESHIFILSPYLAKIFNVFSFSFVHIMYAFIGLFIYKMFSDNLFLDMRSKKFMSALLEVCFIFICFVLAKYIYNIGPYKLPNFEVNYFISLLIFLMFMKLETTSIRLPCYGAVRYISNISYPIYTLHYHVGALLLFLLVSSDIITSNIIIYLLVFSGIVLVAGIFHKYIDKPSIKLLS